MPSYILRAKEVSSFLKRKRWPKTGHSKAVCSTGDGSVGTVPARGTLFKISRLVPLLTHTGRRQSVAEQAEADTEKDKRVKAQNESGKLFNRGRNRNTQPRRKTGS